MKEIAQVIGKSENVTIQRVNQAPKSSRKDAAVDRFGHIHKDL